MRPTLITGPLLLTAALLLAGCGREVPVADGLAGPVTGPSPPASATPASSPASSPAPTPTARTSSKPAGTTKPPAPPATSAPAASGQVLGPFGLGPLKIGMTTEAATATGRVRPWRASSDREGCFSTRLTGAPTTMNSGGYVLTSDDGRIAIISAYGSIRTPEGARLGMAWSRVKQIYPDAARGSEPDNVAPARVEVPGNPAAFYWFFVEDGRVTSLEFGRTQNCPD